MVSVTARRSLVLLASLTVFVLAGCATTVPKPEFSNHVASSLKIRPGDQVKVDVNASQGVKILPYQEQRFAEEIKQKIEEMRKANPPAQTPVNYAVDVHLTRYQKGSKFERLMLAGLGQIHIDGDVDVFSLPQHKLLEAFAMKKTFAWGGVYGATTSIEDIENTFAAGVAQTVTGRRGTTSPDAKD